MYDYFEDAVDESERTLSEKVLIPSKSTFNGKRYDGWDQSKRERVVNRCEGTIVVTHTDADGLVSAALLKDWYGDDVEYIEVGYDGMTDVFRLIRDEGDDIERVFVTDLNLDEVPSVVGDVSKSVSEMVWLDHHEWEDHEQEVEDMGIDITVNQNRCGAGIVCQYLQEVEGYRPSDSAREVVQMTEDHDLWNHEMDDVLLGGDSVCISRVFADFAFWSDSDDFVDSVLEMGVEFLDYEEEMLWSGKGSGFLAQRQAEHNLKLRYILENEVSVESVGEYTVAFAHGRANPGELVESIDGEFDFLVHTKPAYPVKVSIRATDTSEFNRCHEVAGLFGGGGHEKAAGCTVSTYQSPYEFMGYIYENGEPLQDDFKDQIQTELD